MWSGAEIKKARDELKESQAAFAQRFGVDQATVHRWEKLGPPKRGTARLALSQFLEKAREECQ